MDSDGVRLTDLKVISNGFESKRVSDLRGMGKGIKITVYMSEGKLVAIFFG